MPAARLEVLKPLEVYASVAVAQAPRILGLGDRDHASKTYGCFDRNFWHYGLLDLSNARYQEAALYLALLYGQDRDTPYAGSAIVREWAVSAIRFWASAQKRDGSFDEVYPNERSYVATAFATFAVAEACIRLGFDGVNDALLKAAHWLETNENAVVANQVAGALAALNAVHRKTRDGDCLSAVSKKRDLLLSLQHPEGWFPEYGGWDIGYLSIGLGYLARYAVDAGDEEALGAAERAAGFIGTKVRDNGTYDISETSRGTQYLYPSGLCLTGRDDLISKHVTGIVRNEALNPAWMDDRFCIPMATDYLLAAADGDRP